MSDSLGGSLDPPQVEESTQLGCFSSKNNINRSFCVEFAEVFRFMIKKKSDPENVRKNGLKSSHSSDFSIYL